VAASVGGAVSVCGSSDFLIGSPAFEHATTAPTSGARKKFCEATVTGGCEKNASPSVGAFADNATNSDCHWIGCV
jgi:hypothetical protein